jgi:hypothetical protein
MFGKMLLAASTVALAVTGTAVAQDAVIIDENMRVWRPVPQGEVFAATDCVELSGGTSQFQPSGQDTPSQEDVAGACPPGMVPYSSVITGSTSDSDSADDVTVDTDDNGTDADGGADDDGQSDNGADETDDGTDDGATDN